MGGIMDWQLGCLVGADQHLPKIAVTGTVMQMTLE
jgi:hypothetical protein